MFLGSLMSMERLVARARSAVKIKHGLSSWIAILAIGDFATIIKLNILGLRIVAHLN